MKIVKKTDGNSHRDNGGQTSGSQNTIAAIMAMWFICVTILMFLMIFPHPAHAQYEYRNPVRGMELPSSYFRPVDFDAVPFPSALVSIPGFTEDIIPVLSVNPASAPEILDFDYISVSFHSKSFIPSYRSVENIYHAPDFSPVAGNNRITDTFPASYGEILNHPVEKQLDRPVLSVTYMGSPATIGIQNTMIGLSYQLIRTRESYHPADSPFAIGFAERDGPELPDNSLLLPARSSVIPRDELNRTGHQVSLHIIRRATYQTSTGLRVSGMISSRDGIFSDGYALQHELSLQPYMTFDTDRIRSQWYQHLDVSFGMQHAINENISAGWSAGVLVAEADNQQSAWYRLALDRTRYFPPDRFRDNSEEQYFMLVEQSGQSFYTGPNVIFNFAGRSSASGHYRFLHSRTDALASGSWMFDMNRQDAGQDVIRPNVLQFQRNRELSEVSGSINQVHHRLFAGLQFREWDRLSVYLGVSLDWNRWTYDTSVDDRVNIQWKRMHDDELQVEESVSYGWGGRYTWRSINIPAQLRFHVSSWLQLMAGGQWAAIDSILSEDGEFRPFGTTEVMSSDENHSRKSVRADSYAGLLVQPSDILRIVVLGSVIRCNEQETEWFQPVFGIRMILLP